MFRLNLNHIVILIVECVFFLLFIFFVYKHLKNASHNKIQIINDKNKLSLTKEYYKRRENVDEIDVTASKGASQSNRKG